jgi:hypothetical protein
LVAVVLWFVAVVLEIEPVAVVFWFVAVVLEIDPVAVVFWFVAVVLEIVPDTPCDANAVVKSTVPPDDAVPVTTRNALLL